MSSDEAKTVTPGAIKSQKKIKTTEAQKAPEAKPVSLIYCGPSLPRGILNQFTVYRGGLPKHLDKHFEGCPALKRLFVPVGNLTQTMQAIQKQGSAESVWAAQVLEHFKGGAK